MILPLEPKIQIEHQVKKDQKKEFNFIGTGHKKRGQKLFEIDPSTLDINEVEIQKRTSVNFESKNQISNYKAYINKDHFYTWAINKKNALRKFLNHFKNG